jgi:hypothetical protein
MPPIELVTEDKLEYNFFPAGRDGVVFRVRCSNDAHLALTSNPEESDPMLEVFIGGWKNTKSVIRKNRTKPDVAEADTPDIVSGEEFRGFWIRWTDNVITVGKEGEAAAFVSYENTEPFPINFVGVCTGWGASGNWIVEAPIQSSGSGQAPAWVPAAGAEVPAEALQGGTDCDGEPLFIGRARFEGALIPGKVARAHGVCYVAWGGEEHPVSEYEVLVGGSNTWVPVTGAEIPPNAVPGGESEDGEPLFIGRAAHEGSVTIGKVQPSHGVCYISFGGLEVAYGNYEILTY